MARKWNGTDTVPQEDARRCGIKALWPYARSVCGPLLRKWQCVTLMRHRETRKWIWSNQTVKFQGLTLESFCPSNQWCIVTHTKKTKSNYIRKKNWLKSCFICVPGCKPCMRNYALIPVWKGQDQKHDFIKNGVILQQKAAFPHPQLPNTMPWSGGEQFVSRLMSSKGPWPSRVQTQRKHWKSLNRMIKKWLSSLWDYH